MKRMNEITTQDIKEKLTAGEPIRLILICEPFENDTGIPGSERISMDDIMPNISRIPNDIPVVIYCRNGSRSKAVIYTLEKKYAFTNLLHLGGGLLRYLEEINPPEP